MRLSEMELAAEALGLAKESDIPNLQTAAALAVEKAGAAQAVVDAGASILAAKTEAVAAAATFSDLDKLRSFQTIGRVAAPVTGTPLGARTYYLASPVVRASRVRSIRVYNPGSAGNVRIVVGTRVGSVITETSDTVVPVAPGLNTLTAGQFPQILAAAGQYVGVYAPGLVAVTAGATTDHPGYYDGVGDVNVVDDASITTTNRIEIGIDWDAMTVTEARIAGIEANTTYGTEAGAKALAVAGAGAEVRVGRAAAPNGTLVIPDRPYVFGVAYASDQVAFEAGVFLLSAGNVRFGAWARTGDTWTLKRSVLVALPAGLSIVGQAALVGLRFEAGEYFGFWGGELVPASAIVADSGGYYTPGGPTGDITSFVDATASTSARLEIYVRTVPSSLAALPSAVASLASRLAAVEGAGGQGSPMALAAGYMPTATDWLHVVGYGQSNDIGRKAALLNTTASVIHRTFNVGVAMTQPGLAGGALPDDGAAKFLVESATNPDGGGACGQTKHWTAAYEAARRMARERTARTFFRSSAGKGATGIAGIGYGSAWYPNLRFHAQRAKSLATAAGKTFRVLAVDFDHGETDQQGAVAKATVKGGIAALIDGFQADLATDAVQAATEKVHWLFSTSPYSITVGNGHALAVMELCELPKDGGRPDCHFVLPGYRLVDEDADNTHLTAVSQALKGHYFGRAEAQLIAGRVPDRVWWEGVVAQGQALTAWLLAPKPIEINVALCGVTTDHGLKVTDGTGTLALSSIAVGAAIPAEDVPGWWRTPLSLTLHRSLAANPVFRYGLDFANAQLSAIGGAGGDLFDTTTDTCVIAGVTHSMAHPAPVCSLPIVVID